MKYEIDLTPYPEFETTLLEIVNELTLLGHKTSVPELLIKLAKGLSINEIINYEVEHR